MDGVSDPFFPAHHLLSILQTFATDCSVLVNVLISELYWEEEHFLNGLKPLSALENKQDTSSDSLQSLAQIIRVAGTTDYRGSEASYGRFLNKIARFVGDRLHIEARAGRPLLLHGSSCVQPLVVARSVVLENITFVDKKLKSALETFVKQSLSTVKIAIRNCLIIPHEIFALCDILGNSGVGFVSFQQYGVPFERDCQLNTSLTSAALLLNANLQALELDCPLSVSNLESAARFLDSQVASAKLVIHVRISRFLGELDQARLFLSKLRELCSSEHGARIQVVVHSKASKVWGGEPLKGIQAIPGLADYNPLDQFERDIQSKVWLERFIFFGGMLEIVYMAWATRRAFAAAYNPDVDCYWVGYIPLSCGVPGPVAHLIWMTTAATLRGKGDWLGMLMGVTFSVIPMQVLGLYALFAFCLYLSICAAFTLAIKLYGFVKAVLVRAIQ